MAVQPKAVILYARLGSVYYPVACAKDVSITTTADLIELAPRTSSVWREYEYGRMTGKITGSGITSLSPVGSLYTVFDVLGQQLNQLKFLVKLSVEENGEYKVIEARVLAEEVNISGSAAALSNYTYSLQITGGLSISSTPVENTNPQILVYEYTALGGENQFTIPDISANATIIIAYVNGSSKKVVNEPDAYGANEFQYDGAGTLTYGSSFLMDDYVKVVYIDVDSVIDLFLQDGLGNTIDTGNGEELLIA